MEESKEKSYYLVRGEDFYHTQQSFTGTLMEHYKLDQNYQKICQKSLPDKYTHFIQDIRMPNDSNKGKSELRKLLESEPFDRPIQEFSEDSLRSAFTFKPVKKTTSMKIKTMNGNSTINHRKSPASSPPNTTSTSIGSTSLAPNLTRPNGSHVASTSASKSSNDTSKSSEQSRREKKEKKRKKREQEEGQEIKGILQRLIYEARHLSWKGWIVNGKPSNPFLQKITRSNCRSLGVPNYFDFVTTPMDLTTIREKVDRTEYRTLDAFVGDIHLVVENAQKFNRIGEPVHKMATELKEFVEKKITETFQKEYDRILSERKKRRKEKKKKKEKKKEKEKEK